MTATLTNDIAAFIREVDGDNAMDSDVLGLKIAQHVLPAGDVRIKDMAGWIGWINADKNMGAGRLAELIVAEFDLNEES